ncbi:ARM repeat-containing protein [Phellopilus nigrolimitatus]|nr:ARM repeat-containing protein [Phellopilus nigrolimitatus]KAH8109907.1 ARM repeat-containing protein [Phellopilus nigrolimitatus]
MAVAASAKHTKKRAAPAATAVAAAHSQTDGDGPARKKLKSHSDKPKSARKNAPAPALREDRKRVTRKMPVTSTRIAYVDEEDEDEDGGDEWEDMEGEGEGLGEEDGYEDEDEEMDVVEDKSGGAPQKDPKSTREAHKAQKALQNERRAAKTHAALLAEAKALWAQVRRKDVPRAERTKLITELMRVVRGKVQDVVFKHDASRIVQTLVKYGSQAERDEVAGELKGRFKELAQSRYSKFLVTKLIRSCPAHRAALLLEFRGAVVRLLLHREAGAVLADAYELHANAFERALLLHDFYGREAALFAAPALAGGAAARADEREKAQLKKGLAGVLEGADAERRRRILAAVKENVELVLNNPEKGAISHAIFHRVLWEYLVEVNALDDEALQEKLRHELFEACQEVLAEMVHTKDGSRVVREFIAQGSAKDRKQVVKVLKPHIERICKDEEAQLVLFTALDVIDDTKLTAKALVAEVTSRAGELYASPQGRRALLYLLIPRVPRHFTPALGARLAETDAARARTSKKDATLRTNELRAAASAPLVALLEDPARAEALVRDPGGSLLVVEVMLYAEGDKAGATAALLGLLDAPYPAPAGAPPHVLDVPHASRAYKTLLQGGHFSQQARVIERAPASAHNAAGFARAWLARVGEARTRAVGQAGGAFVVGALAERVREEGTAEERGELRGWFGDEWRRAVEEGEVKGKKVLLDALDAL